jgi:hypothetical protein
MLALSLVAPVSSAGPSAPGPAQPAAIPAFSTQGPGEGLPAGWRALVPPHAKAPRFARVEQDGTTVLQVRSHGEAGAAAVALHADAARTPVLAWRWKIDRVVGRADLATKAGDDFAARVYVFFDVPATELPFGARAKLALGRLLFGAELPSAAICYVWDNRHPKGTAVWSAYTDRVRIVVLESGAALAGRWVEERRDLAADYRAAFGERAPLHAISGVAVGNDTDQTGEAASAWFGDLELEGGA